VIQNQSVLAQEENLSKTDPNFINDSAFPAGKKVPLTSHESLLLGEMLKSRNLTESGDNITSVIDQTTMPGFPAAPTLLHLRVQIDSIAVFRDHDPSGRGDGEWHLLGTVNCCGNAINSQMPTRGFSFNAPGVEKEGEIDTPDDEMNDVRGEYRGNWGTIERIPFADVKQDFDVENTGLGEIDINFFGFEDDALTSTDFPSIPDIPSMPYDDYVRAAFEATKWLNNLGGNEHLGNVHLVFTKANNWGIGADNTGFYYAASDDVYSNIWYASESDEIDCNIEPICGHAINTDWPDYPDYIINFRIIDKEPRCPNPGDTYNYTTDQCTGVIIR
jgi:hypothetical protein